jgi:hypothetical protein
VSLSDDKKKHKLKVKVTELSGKLVEVSERNRQLERVAEDLKTQISVLTFNLNEMQTALDEKDLYISKLLREEGFKKKGPAGPTNEEALRKKLEEMKKMIAKINQEKELLVERLHNSERAKQKDTKTVEIYRQELERLSSELEHYRHYVKDNTQDQMSLRKKTDMIKMESELRQRNKYIDTLLETIRELKSGRGNNSSLNKSSNSQAQRFSSKQEYKNILDSSKNSLSR